MLSGMALLADSLPRDRRRPRSPRDRHFDRASEAALGGLVDVPFDSGLGLDLAGVQGAIEPMLLVVAVLAAMLFTLCDSCTLVGVRACVGPRRGVAVASCRPHAWSTPRLRSPSRSAVCSPTCSGRDQTSRSPTSPSRGTSPRRSATRRRADDGIERSLTTRSSALVAVGVRARARPERQRAPLPRLWLRRARHPPGGAGMTATVTTAGLGARSPRRWFRSRRRPRRTDRRSA